MSRKDWRGKSFGLQSTVHPRESDPKVVLGPGDVTTSQTLRGRVLVWCQQNYYLRLLLIVRYFALSYSTVGLLPLRLTPKEKRARK